MGRGKPGYQLGWTGCSTGGDSNTSNHTPNRVYYILSVLLLLYSEEVTSELTKFLIYCGSTLALVFNIEFSISFNHFVIHEVHIKGRLAEEDGLGSLEQVVGWEDKPDLDWGSLGEVVEGNPEEGTPAVEEVGSNVAEGNPVLVKAADIRRD